MSNNTELYEKLSKLQWLLQRHHMVNHAAHGPFADTTRGQGRVMAALKMQPEISTKDLSYLLGITIPSLNELLSKLEKKGYIVRTPSQADKRVMLIQLTEQGKEAQPADTDHSSIFNCLTEEEQKAFGDYLDRVIGALQEQVGNMPDEEAMNHWMERARARMGNERFNNFMKQGGNFGGFGAGMHDDRHGHMHGRMRACGHMHGPMPGGGRFNPGYDGPMPEDREAQFGHPNRGVNDTDTKKEDGK